MAATTNPNATPEPLHAEIGRLQDRLEAMTAIIHRLQEDAAGLAEMARRGYTGTCEIPPLNVEDRLSALSDLNNRLGTLQDAVWASRYAAMRDLERLLNREFQKLCKAAGVTWSIQGSMSQSAEVVLYHPHGGKIGNLRQYPA